MLSSKTTAPRDMAEIAMISRANLSKERLFIDAVAREAASRYIAVTSGRGQEKESYRRFLVRPDDMNSWAGSTFRATAIRPMLIR
jgi:hypothetical protein